jgi:hypothetical protein
VRVGTSSSSLSPRGGSASSSGRRVGFPIAHLGARRLARTCAATCGRPLPSSVEACPSRVAAEGRRFGPFPISPSCVRHCKGRGGGGGANKPKMTKKLLAGGRGFSRRGSRVMEPNSPPHPV